MEEMKLYPAGDRALTVELGDRIDETINDRVQNLAKRINDEEICGVQELVPTYRSLLILYDPLLITYEELGQKIRALSQKQKEQSKERRRIWNIPCCYGGEYGKDLKSVCEITGLSEKKIVKIHSSVEYKIYMLGFLPGFVYLGGLDKRICVPRLSTPRTLIPEGSVGIGGDQTGVYPIASPGGWRLIGSTPVRFYDPNRKDAILCKAGDVISFVPIEEKEYEDIQEAVQRGTYFPTFSLSS